MEKLFLQACYSGQMDVIDELIDKVDINCVDEYNSTGLILACESREPWAIDVVNKLLCHGADVNIEDRTGYDALDIVLGQADFRPQLASLLLLCGKDGIGKLDADGCSRIWACETIDSYRFVIENGGDVNQTPEERTVYYYAKYELRVLEQGPGIENNSKQRELVRYLKSVGATKTNK